MKKSRIDINLGCGHAILSFFLGLIGLAVVVGAIFLLFFPFCFTNTSLISKLEQLVSAKG